MENDVIHITGSTEYIVMLPGRTDRRSKATCAENSVKFVHVVSEICVRTHTHTHTRSVMSGLLTPYNSSFLYQWRMQGYERVLRISLTGETELSEAEQIFCQIQLTSSPILYIYSNFMHFLGTESPDNMAAALPLSSPLFLAHVV